MSLTTKVLVALIAGMALGVAASMSGSPALVRAAIWIEPVGTLFINAIRMTVIPLVMGSLVVGVASARDPRSIGRIGVRALAVFVVTLLVGTVFAVIVAPPLIRLFPLDEAARASISSGTAAVATAAADGARKIPTFAQWLVDLIPVNPVKAAADGALLPLIIFSILFGLAIARLTLDRREGLIRFFDGVAQASLILVRWILELAPLGVFALTVPLAARMGASAAGAVAYYILVVVVVTVAFCLLVLYPLAIFGGRVAPGDFARAALPPQAVAISARSSLAALPAMMESARSRLGLPEEIVSFLLPLAASTYRPGGAIGIIVGVTFLAHLYGVALGSTQLATIVLTVVLATFSVPGIPGGSILIMAPVLMAAGIDVAGLGILLGVDTIPDMFRTATNVTGDMATATVLGRSQRRAVATTP
ncbi:MAG: dicarboxylate/amino acid:cation symporter [Gemmatimonadaceae bacterium]